MQCFVFLIRHENTSVRVKSHLVQFLKLELIGIGNVIANIQLCIAIVLYNTKQCNACMQ